MNPLNNQASQIIAQFKNPKVRNQIKSMVALYRGDKQKFVQSYINSNPNLQNNQIVQSLLSGNCDTNQLMNGVLSQYGVDPNELQKMLKEIVEE